MTSLGIIYIGHVYIVGIYVGWLFWAALGSTVSIYYKAAKQVLGRIQDNELKSDLRREKLVDGRLQIRQLAAFKTKDCVRMYSREQFVTDILSTFSGGNTKKQALQGYAQICKAVLRYLDTQEAHVDFTFSQQGD